MPATAMRKRKLSPLRLSPEAFVWTAGLIALAATDPAAEGLVQGCLFRWLGVEACPGCGLGHAVAHLFRGAFIASFEAHPLGGFAVLVLVARIITLVREASGFRVPAPLSDHTETHNPQPAIDYV